jgi:cytochrome c oxidase subunit II
MKPLSPHGHGADVISREMWIQFGVSSFTFALVIGLLLWILLRRSRGDATPEEVAAERRPQRWVVLGGIVFPVVVLSALFGWSVHDLVALEDPPSRETAVVQVLGHRWWWEIQYPAEEIKTANHIVLPADGSVRVRVRSRDVIHTFWVPALGRKIDALPNEWNTIWLHADRPGQYRGVCAEFCGLQHAHMHLIVDVLPRQQYDSWIVAARADARKPSTASQTRGLHVFESETCAYCHTIKGTEAHGWAGPVLTHLASQPTLAAATLPNTRANLRAWISDPESIKPGVLMPPAHLSDSDLQALLDYLTSLK